MRLYRNYVGEHYRDENGSYELDADEAMRHIGSIVTISA